MFNSSLMGVEIAGKFDNEAYDIARSVIAELGTDTTLPIGEVMDITAAGTGTVEKPIDSRLPYRQLQGLARIGQLNNSNESGGGAINNLRGAWGEAIALNDFRSFPGIVVYEPVRQLAAVEQRIGAALIPGYRGNILKAFGNKTPDILSIQSPVEAPGGFFAPTLTNVVNPNNIREVFDIPYPNKTLVTAVETTTTDRRAWIKKKSESLASFANPFPNSSDKVFVPILYMDKAVFNKLQNMQEIVDKMGSVGGYVMLKKDLLENASNLANNTATIINNRVRALSNQANRNIENDKLSYNSSTHSPVIIDQKGFPSSEVIPSNTEPLPSTNTLDTQKNLINQPNHQLVVAKIMAKASKFTALGLDVRNEKDLNIAIAITSKVGGWDTKKVLGQAPQYKSLAPDKKEAWLDGVINKASELLSSQKADSKPQNQKVQSQNER
jgi:hypothetical protein